MKKKKRIAYIPVSIIVHALFLLTVYTFQGMIFPHIRIFGLVPLLLPIVVTGAAIFEGRDTGGIFGLFAGILCDLALNEPIGVFTVLLTVVGLVVGSLADNVLSRSFLSFYITSFFVLSICATVQMFPLLFFAEIPIGALFMVAVRQTLYSMLFAFPLYFFVRVLPRTGV